MGSEEIKCNTKSERTSRYTSANKNGLTVESNQQKICKTNLKWPKWLHSIHWLLARSYLAHTVFLFLLLGERAGRDKTPPIEPVFIYAQGVLAFLTYCGLSSGVLVVASVFAVASCHFSMGLIFMYNIRLAYPRWLRARSSLRSLLCAGIHLRLLGNSNLLPSFSTTVSWKSSIFDYLGQLGLCFSSIALALLSLTCLPPEAVLLDRELQHHEAAALFNGYALSWFARLLIGGLIACLLGFASVCYALPVLIRGIEAGQNWQTKLFRFADYASGLGILLLCSLHDVSFSYWTLQGTDFWLQMSHILNDLIYLLGVGVNASLQRQNQNS